MLHISWWAWNIKYLFIPGDSVVGVGGMGNSVVGVGGMGDSVVGVGGMVEFVSHLYNRFNFKMSDCYRRRESELTFK
jgi:hypothetical protein